MERVSRRLAWRPPPAAPSPAGRTVTDVHRFALCAKQYRYSRTVPAPPPEEGAAGLPAEAGERGGADLGSLFHRAMERAVRARTSGLRVPPPPPGDAGLWRDAVLAHPDWRSLTGEGELFTELSFAAHVGGALLRGQIDLLVRRGNRWHVLDYKTDRGKPRHVADRYADSLALYRLAVRATAGAEAEVAASVVAVREGAVLPVPPEADRVALDLLARFDGAAAGGAYPATPSEACRFCDWRAICPDREGAAETPPEGPPQAPGRNG
jgi:RecB family exonuclease